MTGDLVTIVMGFGNNSVDLGVLALAHYMPINIASGARSSINLGQLQNHKGGEAMRNSIEQLKVVGPIKYLTLAGYKAYEIAHTLIRH